MGARRHNHNRRHKAHKVTRRIDAGKFRFPKNFDFATVGKVWDPKKTARQNFAALGLLQSMNDDKAVQGVAIHRLQDALGIKLEWVEIDEATAAKVKEVTQPKDGKAPPDYVPPEEAEYLTRLITKYSHNYAAMAKDAKLNFWLHSAQHLETRIARLERYQVALKAEQDAAAAGTK